MGEDKGFVSLGRELGHPFLDIRQFAGLAGPGIRVANLLEPGNQLQHMLNAHFGSQERARTSPLSAALVELRFLAR